MNATPTHPRIVPHGGGPRRTRPARVLLTGLAAAAAALPLAATAHASGVGDIAVPTGNKLFLTGHATGVQIYTCNAVDGGFAWSSATPRADLRDDNGKLIVTHFAGPSWQAKDGSTVVGRREAGVTVDTSAIAWLRLAAASTSAGADGDRLVPTTYIQRINTAGGLTPAAGQCNALTAGSVAEVPYTADYLFWKRTGGG